MKAATVYVDFTDFEDDYDFPTIKMAEDFMKDLQEKGHKVRIVIHSTTNIPAFFSLLPVLMIFMTVGCGDITQLEAQIKQQQAAGQVTVTPTATPTPVSEVVVDSHESVSQYGKEEPVTVTTTVTIGAQPTATPTPAKSNLIDMCDSEPHGEIKQYFVVTRETQNWPWKIEETTKSEDKALKKANELVNNGFFPWNVNVMKQFDNGCVLED